MRTGWVMHVCLGVDESGPKCIYIQKKLLKAMGKMSGGAK